MAEIVELISFDPPIAVVTRFINSYNRVTTCRRKKSEDLSVFVSTFRGLAAEHIMHFKVTSSKQIAEVLAITLLNNSNLKESTLINAKLQLIALAENRAKDQNRHFQDTVQVRKSFLEEIQDLKEKY